MEDKNNYNENAIEEAMNFFHKPLFRIGSYNHPNFMTAVDVLQNLHIDQINNMIKMLEEEKQRRLNNKEI